MSWANAYAGLPFLAGGRGHAGLDCWGLYRLVLTERAGVMLPAWDMVAWDDLRAVYRAMRAEADGEAWRKVETPSSLDLVLMRGHFETGDGNLRGGPVHVGCFVEPGLVLHIEEGIDAMIVPLASVAWRVLGFYRPRGPA